MFLPGKDSPCYLIVLKDKPPAQLLPSSCPPVQGCEVQILFLKEPPHILPPFLREQNLTERGGEMELPTFFTALDSCGGKNGIMFPHECCANPAQMGSLEVTQPRALEVSQSKTISLSNSFPLVSSLNSAKGTRNAT